MDISSEMIKRASSPSTARLEINRGPAGAQLIEYFERNGAHWR
jgi:chemotaxis protein methyltransferase CheR